MMKKTIKFTALVLILTMILPFVSPMSFEAAAKPVAIVVGHTNGVATAENVSQAKKAAGLEEWDYTPFTVTFSPGVTSIGEWAFNFEYFLIGIDIPSSVTSIRDFAFSQCYSLANIVIPNSVTSIGKWAFFECKSLANITFSNNLTSIGEQAFYSCESLKKVVIPNSVKTIGKEAFSYCKSLTEVVIGTGLSSISNMTFYHCLSLKKITIPRNVKSIKDYEFEGCFKLTIYCFKDSYAHKYAVKENYKFVFLDAPAKKNASKPTIKTQPRSKYTVKKNASLKLRVSATVKRGKLSYQWYKGKNMKNTGGRKIKGATKRTYIVKTGKKGTAYYYCVIKNKDNKATGKKTASRTSGSSKVVIK